MQKTNAMVRHQEILMRVALTPDPLPE